jgi:hypothetical protein
VIGQREGREAQLGCPGDETDVLFLLPLPLHALDLLELGGAVEKAVLRVDVEMDEVGAWRAGLCEAFYSHSMVLGGFEEMS